MGVGEKGQVLEEKVDSKIEPSWVWQFFSFNESQLTEELKYFFEPLLYPKKVVNPETDGWPGFMKRLSEKVSGKFISEIAELYNQRILALSNARLKGDYDDKERIDREFLKKFEEYLKT